MMRSLVLCLTVATAGLSCSSTGSTSVPRQSHSGPLLVSEDGSRLFVVHPDADRVSILDVGSRKILHETALGDAPPALTGAPPRFDALVAPRALALDSGGRTLFVTGQRSGEVYALDAVSGAILRHAPICSEPVGILVGQGDSNLYVACAQDDEVVQIDPSSLAIRAHVVTPRKPWALAWAADGTTLLATHLLGPGVSRIGTAPLTLQATWPLADQAGGSDPTEPHGVVRGIYDVAARPASGEIWSAHLMLGIDTPQPTLVFNSTVFPALSVLDGTTGQQRARLSVAVNPGDGGAFGDVVSGPRAMAFSGDGRFVFVADTDSEDLLVVDATARAEATLVRPLPGHLPEGVFWTDHDVYVQERNTEDIVAFKVEEPTDAEGSTLSITQDGPAFSTLAHDPMPASLRLGQKLFFSANSDDVPVTQDHWVACASCHVEGRSDAVTWEFAQGPRDTPSNAGGTLDTGFLFRTADRTRVQDYWKTIDVEQGGSFAANGVQQPLLDAIADYVNEALSVPIPPSTDATHSLSGAELAALRARGQTVFGQAGCPACHTGPAFTDSGQGNPLLDLSGPVVTSSTAGGILLHDVGTCVTSGPWPDAVHDDLSGDPRPACAFDTPSLRGLTDSAPFFHDGSAATLEDVLPVMLRALNPSGAAPSPLSSSDHTALIEYLRSL